MPEEGPRHDCVLVRYGELALKSRRVRARFTAQLKEFVLEAFQADDLDCVIEDDGGHLYVQSSDLVRACHRLTRVFGVVSVSPAMKVEVSTLEALASDVASYSRHVLEPGQTFAIRARRTGQHGFTSMDLGKVAGSAVWEAFSGQLEVDLTRPNVAIAVEVRARVAYIYHEKLPGVGGLPPGSQGRVLCPLREPADAVAGWLLMRRGCFAVPIVPEGDERAADLVAALTLWDPRLQARSLPMAEWDWPALYREMGRSRSLAVVLGARGPEVPSLPPDRGRDPVAFFPLVGLDDGAYKRLEQRVLG